MLYSRRNGEKTSGHFFLCRPLCTVAATALVLLAAVMRLSCTALEVPREPVGAGPNVPTWSADEFDAHLRFFNGQGIEGRATGTQGYARAAAYVAARLREYSLQPAFGTDFRVIYSTPLSYPRGASLLAVDGDTLQFYAGLDMLPDGRSEGGRMRIERLIPGSPLRLDGNADPETGWLVLQETLTNEILEKAAARNVRAVLAVGSLYPSVAARPITGVTMLQLTSGAAAELTDLTEERLKTMLTGPSQGVLELPRALQVWLGAEHVRLGGAINIVGYIPGKHPVHRSEAILLCADLDGLGYPMDLQFFSPDYDGTGTAALLELAKEYVHVSQFEHRPERTVIVAVWSGARQDHAGLRHFLSSPTWPLDQIHRMIYVGANPEEASRLQALAGQHDLAVDLLLDEALSGEGWFYPDRATIRLAELRADTTMQRTDPSIGDYLVTAQQQAAEWAQRGFALLRSMDTVSQKP